MVDWSKTPFANALMGQNQNGLLSGATMAATSNSTTPAFSSNGLLSTQKTGSTAAPTFKTFDIDKLPKYKGSGIDWSTYASTLAAPGAASINQSFDKSDNTNRDVLGGGGLYGSSIYADVNTQSANQRGSALASNMSNAQNTATQGLMSEVQAENDYNVQMQKLLFDMINGENTFNLDAWKNTSQLEQEQKLTNQNQAWQSGENTLNRNQDTWKTQGSWDQTASENLKDRLWKSDLQTSQNQFDLSKLDKTFTHDYSTLQKTQDFQKLMQEYLYGKINENQQVFDELTYLKNNPDVADAVNEGKVLNGEQHYQFYGQDEGRAPYYKTDNVYVPGVQQSANSESAVLNYLLNKMLQEQQQKATAELQNKQISASEDAANTSGAMSLAAALAGAVIANGYKYLPGN